MHFTSSSWSGFGRTLRAAGALVALVGFTTPAHAQEAVAAPTAPATPAPPTYPPPPAYAPPTGDPPAAVESYQADVAPAPPQRRFGLFIDPLNLLLSRTLGIEGSLALHRAIALNVGVQYASISSTDAYGEDVDVRAYGVRGGFQIFPLTDRALRGFYLYPRATYVSASSDSTKYVQSATGSGYELAGMAGYQWNWRNGFAIRLGGGVRYIDLEVEAKSTTPGLASSKVSSQGTYPILEFALGWTF
jgi:hypothetical protein